MKIKLKFMEKMDCENCDEQLEKLCKSRKFKITDSRLDEIEFIVTQDYTEAIITTDRTVENPRTFKMKKETLFVITMVEPGKKPYTKRYISSTQFKTALHKLTDDKIGEFSIDFVHDEDSYSVVSAFIGTVNEDKNINDAMLTRYAVTFIDENQKKTARIFLEHKLQKIRHKRNQLNKMLENITNYAIELDEEFSDIIKNNKLVNFKSTSFLFHFLKHNDEKANDGVSLVKMLLGADITGFQYQFDKVDFINTTYNNTAAIMGEDRMDEIIDDDTEFNEVVEGLIQANQVGEQVADQIMENLGDLFKNMSRLGEDEEEKEEEIILN